MSALGSLSPSLRIGIALYCTSLLSRTGCLCLHLLSPYFSSSCACNIASSLFRKSAQSRVHATRSRQPPPPGGTFALKERRRERAVIIFAVSYSFRSTCASPLPLPPTHTRCYGLLPPSCLSAVCRSFWVFSVGFCALCLRHRSLSSRVPLISSLSLPFLACCSGARALPLFVHAIIYHWLVGCIILKLAERNQRHQEAEGTKENNKETKAVFSSCAPSRL